MERSCEERFAGHSAETMRHTDSTRYSRTTNVLFGIPSIANYDRNSHFPGNALIREFTRKVISLLKRAIRGLPAGTGMPNENS